jgi:UV excision repair protein RAD23
MKLILKNLKQVEFEIFIDSEKITVKEFKKEIEKLYSFDSEQIKLIFNGTMLENDKTLEEYEIRENNHIIIMNTKIKIIKNESIPKPIEYQEKPQQIKPEIQPKDKPNISQVLRDNWTEQVNSLVNMGFERSQAEVAVKATNGNIELAIDYLNNGKSDDKVNNNNRNNNIQRQNNKDDITKELKKQAGVIKMLCKDNKLRIFEILNNIKYNDPGLMRLITDYRDDFKNYLDSPITEEDKQNYEKIEAEADKIQQERKEKRGFCSSKTKRAIPRV